MEAKIKKIKSEIKEMEIKMDKAAESSQVAEAQDKTSTGADQDEKDNAMTFAYSELKSWVGVALNKLLTCQVRDTVSKDSQNSQSLAENFSMLAKHLDEISTELEKSEDLEKDLEYLDDEQLKDLNINEKEHFRNDQRNEDSDEKDNFMSEQLLNKEYKAIKAKIEAKKWVD